MASNPLKTSHTHSVADLVTHAREYGANTAQGQDSIMSLATKVYASAKYGSLVPGDIGQIYLAYCEGQNATQYGAKVDVANANSMKAGKSKLTSFVHLAKSPVGSFDVVTRTIGLINRRNAELNKSGKPVKTGGYYERVLKIVRAQVKSKVKLTDDEILEALFPVAAPKGEIEVLESLHKAATSASEKPEFLANSAYFSRIAEFIKGEIDTYRREVLKEESDETGDDSDSDVDLSEITTLLQTAA